MSFNSDTWQT